MKYFIIIISLLLLLVSGTYVCSERCCVYCSNDIEENQIIERISVNEFYNGINENIVLIDIRTPEEYNEGHIENAINIDYYANDFSNQINSLDKEKTYYIYCRSGSRSGNALKIFEDLGFKEVYDLRHGINSWKENGFEVK
jgi:phage shock protein E